MTLVYDVLKGVAAVAFGILFLFEGITFGCISVDGCITSYEDKPRLFVLQYARGFSFVLIVYFISVMIISMIYGYYDVFVIIFGLLATAVSMAICACISQEYEQWSFPLALSGLPLIIKFTHTAYYLINETLITNHNSNIGSSGLYTFLFISLIFECLLLLGWSLWPFLSIKSTEQSIPLTIWGLEYCDIISHLIVCIVYANSISPENKWNDTHVLQAYFAFWILNLYFWTIPLYPMIKHIVNEENDHQLLGIHIFIVDIITDLPFLIITLAGRTYYNNAYIAFDIAVKCILLCRGIIWIPIVVFGDRFKLKLFGTWDYRLKQVKNVSLNEESQPKKFRRRAHSV